MSNLPATSKSGVSLPTEDPWAELRDAFDDGSARFREHIGVSLPRLRSDFGRNGKGWIDELTGEVYGELDIAILAYPPQRTFWLVDLDEAGGKSTPPDCKSWDMVRPDPESPAPQSETCARCKWSKWESDRKGGKGKACKESAGVIAYDFEHSQFLWLRFGGTALTPFKAYISALSGRRLPTFAVRTKVKLKDEKEGRFEWKVPAFTITEHLTPEDVRPLRDVAAMAMEAWQSVVEEMATNEEFIDDDSTDDPGPNEPMGGYGEDVIAEHFPDSEPF